jgi:hypothetical protein
MFCRLLFVRLCFFLLTIVMSVLLRYMDSHYLFGILKLLFLEKAKVHWIVLWGNFIYMFCRSLFVRLCFFSFSHCDVCPSSIYGLWLPLWYLQTILINYCSTLKLWKYKYTWFSCVWSILLNMSTFYFAFATYQLKNIFILWGNLFLTQWALSTNVYLSETTSAGSNMKGLIFCWATFTSSALKSF